MTGHLLTIVTLLYAGAAIDSAWHGHWPMACILTGYTLANVGLILASHGAP